MGILERFEILQRKLTAIPFAGTFNRHPGKWPAAGGSRITKAERADAFASQANHQADQRDDTQKMHGYLFFDVAEFLETFSNFFRLD